jgi:hypothetical protein
MYPSGFASFGRTTCTISLTESDAGFGAGGMDGQPFGAEKFDAEAGLSGYF